MVERTLKESDMRNYFYIVPVIILFMPDIVSGQKKPFQIKSERKDDKSVVFSFEKNFPGSVHVIIEFKMLENSSGKRTVTKSVKGYSGNLFTLKPLNSDRGIGFSYTYNYFIGNKNAKPDLEHKYALPFKPGKSIHVKKLSYLGNKYGKEAPKNWTSFQFLTEPNDTVCAARKGLVIKIVDDNKPNAQLDYGYRQDANYILIEHDDGTIARYGVIREKGGLVKVGEEIFPGTPIAISGTYDKPENSQLRFSIYYMDKDMDYNIFKEYTLQNRPDIYAYLNPKFKTKEYLGELHSNKDYTVVLDDEMITSEMSKRERKKYQKKKVK